MTQRRAPLHGFANPFPLAVAALLNSPSNPETPLFRLLKRGRRKTPREKRRRTSHRQISEGGNTTQRTAHACGGTEHCHRRPPPSRRTKSQRGRTRDTAKGRRSKRKDGESRERKLATRNERGWPTFKSPTTRAPKLVIFPPDYNAAALSSLHAPPRMLRPRCADPRGKRGDQTNFFFFRDQQTPRNHQRARNQTNPPNGNSKKRR